MTNLLLTALLTGAPPSPPTRPAPVLFTRVVAPVGVKIAFRPASGGPLHPAPADAGLRPGYVYRFRLTDIPGKPGISLYPSVEVRAGLFMPVNLNPRDFPATIAFSETDLKRAIDGSFIVKVIYLEDPDLAAAEESTVDQPLEFPTPTGENPLALARERGRPLLIVRLGGREPSPDELAAVDVPGTLLAPGEIGLPAPAAPPHLPPIAFRLFDPTAGPRLPHEELLADGGDVKLRVGIGPDGRIGNVDPTDTAIEFRQGNGPKRTAVSNRVCLFAPRFPAIRAEMNPDAHHQPYAPHDDTAVKGPNTLRRDAVPGLTVQRTSAVVDVGRDVLRQMRSRQGVHSLDHLVGPQAVAVVEGLAVKATVIEPITATQINDHCKPDQPLVLVKTADPREAKPGDTVTFTLKYINYGSRPMSDLAITDSLAARFEYVPGSTAGDRPAAFTVRPNEVGSSVLRWEIAGQLLPASSGVIQFRVKVK